MHPLRRRSLEANILGFLGEGPATAGKVRAHLGTSWGSVLDVLGGMVKAGNLRVLRGRANAHWYALASTPNAQIREAVARADPGLNDVWWLIHLIPGLPFGQIIRERGSLPFTRNGRAVPKSTMENRLRQLVKLGIVERRSEKTKRFSRRRRPDALIWLGEEQPFSGYFETVSWGGGLPSKLKPDPQRKMEEREDFISRDLPTSKEERRKYFESEEDFREYLARLARLR